MIPFIKNYLNNNFTQIDEINNKKYNSYWWKHYNNFNLFLFKKRNKINYVTKIRNNLTPISIPILDEFISNNKKWKNYTETEFLHFLKEFEKIDKFLSIEEKIKEIQEDF